MILRDERPDDVATIARLTEAAFADHPHSDGSEAVIVERLRAAGALRLSLVAEAKGEILGHAAFSLVTVDGETRGWFGLGPISVWPARQRQGIGSALIEEGLLRLRRFGAAGCFLLGDPAFYSRFGFISSPDLFFGAISAPHLQFVAFAPPHPSGQVEYHESFSL